MITMLPLLLLVICLYAILMDTHYFSPFERKSNLRALWLGARPPLRFWAVLALDVSTQLLMAMLILGLLPASFEVNAIIRFWRGLVLLTAAFALAALWNHWLDTALERLPRIPLLLPRLLALGLLGILIVATLLLTVAVVATPDFGTALIYFLAALPKTLPLACLLALGFYLLRICGFFLRAIPLAGTLLHAAAHTTLLALTMDIFGRMVMGSDLPIGGNTGLQTPVLMIGIGSMIALLLSSYMPGVGKKEDSIEAPTLVKNEPSPIEPQIELHENGGQISYGKTRVEITYDPFGICVYGEQDTVLWKLANGGLRREFNLYSFFSIPVYFTGCLVKTRWLLGGKPIQKPIDMRTEGNKVWINLWDAQIYISYYHEDTLRLEINLRQPKPNPLPEYRVLTLACEAPSDAHFLGFGQRFNQVDWRGRPLPVLLEGTGTAYGKSDSLLQPFSRLFVSRSASNFPMPFFLISCEEGPVSGMFWNSTQPAWVEAGRDGRTSLTILDQKLDLYLCTGPTALEAVRQFTCLTASAGVPPAWAFLPGILRSGTVTENLVREDIVQSRRLGLPQAYVGMENWETLPGSYDIATDRYPLPEDLIKEAHDKGYRITARHYSRITFGSEAFKEGLKKGYFVMNRLGLPYLQRMPGGSASLVDYSNPQAAEWQAELLRSHLLEKGFQGSLLEIGSALPPDAILANGRSGLEMRNAYPLLAARSLQNAGEGVLAGMDSGFTGSQCFNHAWWHAGVDLPSTVRAMLNASTGGLTFHGPTFSSHTPNLDEESGKELFLRQAEVSAYSPWMCMHGARAWQYDQETINIYQALADDHVRLFPYLYSLAKACSQSSLPILRHPALIWHDIHELYQVEDAWMLGDALYVAPLLQPGSTSRNVLLPPGMWWSLSEGKACEGGQSVEVTAVPGCVPLFLRQGFPLPRFVETFDSFDPSDFARLGTLDGDLEVWLFPGSEPADFLLFDGGVLHYHRGKSSLKGGAARKVEWKVFEG